TLYAVAQQRPAVRTPSGCPGSTCPRARPAPGGNARRGTRRRVRRRGWRAHHGGGRNVELPDAVMNARHAAALAMSVAHRAGITDPPLSVQVRAPRTVIVFSPHVAFVPHPAPPTRTTPAARLPPPPLPAPHPP